MAAMSYIVFCSDKFPDNGRCNGTLLVTTLYYDTELDFFELRSHVLIKHG